MTNSGSAKSNSDGGESAPPISEKLRKAVESRQDVAGQVRDIVVNLFRGSDSTTATARAAVNGIMETAIEIVHRSAPEHADSIIRNVIDGVTSGLTKVAQSTQYAVQEAASRGQRFALEDLEKARKDLSGISDILIDTVKYFTNRLTTETGTAFSELKTHAERAAASAAPIVRESIEALARHPIRSASEAASTALRSGQLTAGALLNAVSGVLAGAAELLDPEQGTKNKAEGQKDSAP